MNLTATLTTIAPAILLFIAYLGARFFPPSMGNSFITKAPVWWSRDQETWDKAYVALASKYIIYTIALAVFCAALLLFEWEYASSVGYIILVVFVVLANYQVRSYMRDKVK